MDASLQVKNQHLLWRAAFGPMPENISQLRNISPTELWEILLKKSQKTTSFLQVAVNPVDGLIKGVRESVSAAQKREEARERRRRAAAELKSLNLLWLDQMVFSEAQFREKMSLFWHGHFACRITNSYYQQELLHEIRENAIGNFADLLRGVSKSPAMLRFLNNQQNKKQKPNENFAREVMELFTMGIGNYTEGDVKEAARAFTGWTSNAAGEFIFRKSWHDPGEKTFLGRTGNFNGDDILDIILEQKTTAKFITEKIYAYFVNEKIDERHIESLAAKFYRSGYDLTALMTDIFTSDWFYDEKNMGQKIKSPVELLVGIRRFLPMKIEKPELQLTYERVLGQLLFYPPNVAGWPGDKAWIDSSSLLARLQLAGVLANAAAFSVTPKSDDDIMMGRQEVKKKSKSKKNESLNEVEWAGVIRVFDKVPRAELLDKLKSAVLQKQSALPESLLLRYIDDSSREAYIKTAIVRIMSTPEYQLC